MSFNRCSLCRSLITVRVISYRVYGLPPGLMPLFLQASRNTSRSLVLLALSLVTLLFLPSVPTSGPRSGLVMAQLERRRHSLHLRTAENTGSHLVRQRM